MLGFQVFKPTPQLFMAGKASQENGKKGGRPTGTENKATKARRLALEAYKDRVAKNVNNLLNAQMNLAQGVSVLYRIDTEIIGSGKNEKRIKKRPVIVTDPEEIQNYLDGEYGEGESMNDNDTYYYITTQLPDNRAIDSMMDRVYGRPSQSIDLKDEEGKGILRHLAEAALEANQVKRPEKPKKEAPQSH